MPEYVEEISSSFEEERIGGIDQQKAQACWAKLLERTPDQTLRSPRHLFYCVINVDDEISEQHFYIAVFPPDGNPERDISSADIILIQEQDGSFAVINRSADTETSTQLTGKDINPLLDEIIHATQKHRKETDTVDVIRQIRERL